MLERLYEYGVYRKKVSDKETIREQGMIDKNYKRTSKSNFDHIKVVTNLLLFGHCLFGGI